MPIPYYVRFDPDTPQLRSDFESALLAADVSGLEEGSNDAAGRVALELQRMRPHAMIIWQPGPHWIVGDVD